MFQSFSRKCKNLILQSCPKEFIRFLCKCIKNLLKRTLQSMKRHHVVNFQTEVRLLSLKRTTWKQRRDILASERPKEGYSSLKLLLLQSLTICFDMDQFVLIPASVYNKSLITQSVTKQDLPKYQHSQNLTYQVHSLQEINKKVFSKADSSVDKILSCPPFRLSNSKM